MENLRACVVEDAPRHYIEIDMGEDVLRIPLSEDNPNIVKSAFNKLITKLRNGKYQISIETSGDNLFSQVAKEYIGQLNKELQAVYKELVHFDLVNKQPNTIEISQTKTGA